MDLDALAIAPALRACPPGPVVVVDGRVGQYQVPCFTICATAASLSSSPCSIESQPPSSARCRPEAVVRVAGDLPPPAVRLVDDGLQLLDGERRLRDQLPRARPTHERCVM